MLQVDLLVFLGGQVRIKSVLPSNRLGLNLIDHQMILLILNHLDQQKILAFVVKEEGLEECSLGSQEGLSCCNISCLLHLFISLKLFIYLLEIR